MTAVVENLGLAIRAPFALPHGVPLPAMPAQLFGQDKDDLIAVHIDPRNGTKGDCAVDPVDLAQTVGDRLLQDRVDADEIWHFDAGAPRQRPSRNKIIPHYHAIFCAPGFDS